MFCLDVGRGGSGPELGQALGITQRGGRAIRAVVVFPKKDPSRRV